ncbi:MAG: M23 family metallopeptidase [Acidobacteriia bacterium]|nr:M23 family metallopeptidase [Terriglobia bacterium]
MVYIRDDRADVSASLELRNPGNRTLRVDGLSAVYFAAGLPLRTDRFDPSFFGPTGVGREHKIRGGASAEWTGICLDRVPPEADRVRLAFDLSVRVGLTRHRSEQPFDLELRPAPPPVVLRVPFDGYWLVTQGHSCRTNHRSGGFGSDYAWDFVHFSPTGRIVKEGYETSRRNEDSYSFGLSVLAPADGTLIRVVGDVQDNEGLKDYPRRALLEELERPDWIFGNFVVIELSVGVYVLMAHLERGSVSLKPGDRVHAGDPIARCGNSGNTVWPHLHVQVMDRSDPTDSSVHGLPAAFANYREITYTGDSTHKDILARDISGGDPPEGSIVVAVTPDETRP